MTMLSAIRSVSVIEGAMVVTDGPINGVTFWLASNRFCAVVEALQPDLILTYSPLDYIVDHEETSRLVRNAPFIASVSHYDCGGNMPPTWQTPHLYYCNVAGLCDCFGFPLLRHMAVDISNTMSLKRQVLGCHQPQKEWLRYITGVDDCLEQLDEW